MKNIIPARFKLVTGTFLLSLLLYVDRINISVAEKDIREDLLFSDKQMGWIMGVFAIGYALFQTPSGLLVDKLGPRKVLTSIVSIWSVFTALTAVAWNFSSMMVFRFLFGLGESGAYPSIARATFSWIPLKERGIVNGINFSGSRVGAAVALFTLPGLLIALGWKNVFFILGGIGVAWAVVWWLWFRDTPEESSQISDAEKDFILETRQAATKEEKEQLSLAVLLKSKNMWIAMMQYFCSNYIAYFCLSWLYKYVRDTYGLSPTEAGMYASAPLIAGALGNYFSGFLVDGIYAQGKWVLSRRLPAILGFGISTIGLLMSLGMDSALCATAWLSVAVFGIDMVLSPAWSFCVDFGKKHAGAVSGTMNFMGNVGSFFTSLAFPYLLAWTGTNSTFFYVGAGLNMVAILLWFGAKPNCELSEY